MLKMSAIGVALIVTTPCLAQAPLSGPFNPNTPREIQIQTGTGVGISKPRVTAPASDLPAIGTTFGHTFGTPTGTTVGSQLATPVGTAFGTSVGGLAPP